MWYRRANVWAFVYPMLHIEETKATTSLKTWEKRNKVAISGWKRWLASLLKEKKAAAPLLKFWKVIKVGKKKQEEKY